MNVIHQTRNKLYRDPFGAIPTDETVTLSVQIQGTEFVHDCYLDYCYGLQGFYEGRARMTPSDQYAGFYTCSVKVPGEYCLLFYWFEVMTSTGVQYLVYDAAKKDGSGVLSPIRPKVTQGNKGEVPPFQITVYDRAFHTPDWFKGCVMYQIFPDRFARERQFSYEKMKTKRDYPEYIYHNNWYEDVDYKGTKETGYLACDFFGGSLNGIREHLDYLEKLGIDVIYLNPIFQSRSNHRYDTGNYENIDPLLGTNGDFDKLVEEAAHRSIRIILDGVFSHTGADSVYFNKFQRYQSVGAYQNAEGKGKSPYFSWYHFNLQPGYISYDSWWGFSDLPCVNENDLQYKEYILGPKGIVRNWIKRGTSGWRLDVSDEVPDYFLRELRKAAKKENEDAVIMGEVWEDASNKISYGAFRDFLFGATHDCVMGYPFRDAVTNWLTGRISAADMKNTLENIRENYPVEAFYCNMNLIGSHDIPRPVTELAGDLRIMDRETQAHSRLSIEQRKVGERLLKFAMALQFTYPGTPSIYYGDEIAMEGHRDPFNRRPFPWNYAENSQIEIKQWLTALILFRRQHAVFRTGWIEYIKADEDVMIFRRYFEQGKDAFGKLQEDEGDFYLALNKNPYFYKITIPGYEGALAPYSGVVIQNGIRVFEI